MQNFRKSRHEGKKYTRTTQIRHDDNMAELISQASTSLGVEKSVFLRSIIEKEATRVLEAGSRHVLSADDARRFSAALDKPPAPTLRALAAAKAYQARIVDAD